MKHNVLRGPLLNTAAVLVFFLAMLALSIAEPEATVLGSFGLIILTMLKALQWLIGMALAVTFCIAFLFAIFFGAVALVSPEASGRMYAGCRQPLAAWFTACKKKTEQQPVNTELRQELHANLEAIQGQLHATRDLLAGKIETLAARIDVLEELTAKMADSSQVESLSSEVKNAMDSLAGIEGAVGGMKACVEQTARQILELSPEQVLGDLPERLRLLEARPPVPELIDITPLEQDITVMQQELASVREKADRALLAASAETIAVQEPPPAVSQQAVSAEGSEEAHRIFSYFDSPADRQKLADLVEAALDKRLNQKQVIDYLVRGLGPQKGKVINAHPALIKDYIKSCRRHD